MNFNKRVAFYTLGCKVNQYETNAMEQQFIKNKKSTSSKGVYRNSF